MSISDKSFIFYCYRQQIKSGVWLVSEAHHSDGFKFILKKALITRHAIHLILFLKFISGFHGITEQCFLRFGKGTKVNLSFNWQTIAL